MPKTFHRIVAVILVPCLLTDLVHGSPAKVIPVFEPGLWTKIDGQFTNQALSLEPISIPRRAYDATCRAVNYFWHFLPSYDPLTLWMNGGTLGGGRDGEKEKADHEKTLGPQSTLNRRTSRSHPAPHVDELLSVTMALKTLEFLDREAYVRQQLTPLHRKVLRQAISTLSTARKYLSRERNAIPSEYDNEKILREQLIVRRKIILDQMDADESPHGSFFLRNHFFDRFHYLEIWADEAAYKQLIFPLIAYHQFHSSGRQLLIDVVLNQSRDASGQFNDARFINNIQILANKLASEGFVDRVAESWEVLGASKLMPQNLRTVDRSFWSLVPDTLTSEDIYVATDHPSIAQLREQLDAAFNRTGWGTILPASERDFWINLVMERVQARLQPARSARLFIKGLRSGRILLELLRKDPLCPIDLPDRIEPRQQWIHRQWQEEQVELAVLRPFLRTILGALQSAIRKNQTERPVILIGSSVIRDDRDLDVMTDYDNGTEQVRLDFLSGLPKSISEDNDKVRHVFIEPFEAPGIVMIYKTLVKYHIAYRITADAIYRITESATSPRDSSKSPSGSSSGPNKPLRNAESLLGSA